MRYSIQPRDEAESTGDLISEKNTKVTKKLQQNSLETVKIQHDNDNEIPRDRYIFPEERQKLIVYLRLI